MKPHDWETRMVLFMGFLIENELQSSTIRTYLSAIRGVLLEHNIKINKDQLLINSLTRACKIKKDVIITRLPIERGMLNLLLKEATNYFCSEDGKNQPYLNLLYRAILVSGYYGLLQVGDLTKGPHVILASNVHISENKNKILFILFMSKTHNRSSKPQMVKISQKQIKKKTENSESIRSSENPFTILKQYIAVRPTCQ